jgi:hypothetical protein
MNKQRREEQEEKQRKEELRQFYIDERIRRNAFLIRKQREWELSKQTLSLHHNNQDT